MVIENVCAILRWGIDLIPSEYSARNINTDIETIPLYN